MSLEDRQLKNLEEGEEKWGKLTRGVVSHDGDRVLKGLGCVRWELFVKGTERELKEGVLTDSFFPHVM